jgi:DNA mismatch endonuclease (patch repair protein)
MQPVDRWGVTASPEGVSGQGAGRPRTVNLGRGVIVPYPEPRGEAATKIGKANRRRDTKPEVRLRSALHARGLRFRKDHLLRIADVRVRPDVVFTKRHVAVFVDGCFWHGCPIHQTIPKTNRDYWVPKLRANVERDRRVDAALEGAGWRVLRIWEHEGVDDAATRTEAAVAASRIADPTDRRPRGRRIDEDASG